MISLFFAQIQGLDPLEGSEVLVAQNVFFALIALVMVLAAIKKSEIKYQWKLIRRDHIMFMNNLKK